MLDFGFYNMDCMEGMKEFPDKYFDLAIVDPPYGLRMSNRFQIGSSALAETTKFIPRQWDESPPQLEYLQNCLEFLKTK